MPLLITNIEIAQLLSDGAVLQAAFAVMDGVLAEHSEGRAGLAAHAYLPLADAGRYSLLYHAAPDHGVSLRVFPADGTAAAEQSGCFWLVMHPGDGRLLALLGADGLSPMRTAIPSLACARHLASPGASRMAIVGSGRQAQAHALMMRYAFPSIRQLRCWSPNPVNLRRFTEALRAGTCHEIVECSTRDDATGPADIVLLLGAPGHFQIAAPAVAPGALVVSLSHAVPGEVLEHSIRYVPCDTHPVLALNQPESARRELPPEVRTVAAAVRGETVRDHPDRTVVLELGDLYGWDAPIARWIYEQAVSRGMGTAFSL